MKDSEKDLQDDSAKLMAGTFTDSWGEVHEVPQFDQNEALNALKTDSKGPGVV